MQALTVMMGRVIAKIACQQVEEPVGVVIRGLERVVRIQATVVIMCHPCGE